MQKFEITGLGIDKKTNYPLVILHNQEEDMIVPIWIGPMEAQSIAIIMQGEELERPLTHDLLLDAIEALEATIEKIEIYSVKDKTFYANLYLRDIDDERIILDARPSDCIALAVREDIDIYINDEVIESAGIPAIIHYEKSAKDQSFERFKPEDEAEFRDFLKSVKASDFRLPEDL